MSSTSKQVHRPKKVHLRNKDVLKPKRRGSVGLVNNKKGKGGFGDHPELINREGANAGAQSFSYWFRQFMGMTVKEMTTWEKDHPEDERTVAASLAYVRIINARKDLREFQEIADRVEGKPVKVDLHQTNIGAVNVQNNNQETTINATDIETAEQLLAFRQELEANAGKSINET